jgi:hypothetical protein
MISWPAPTFATVHRRSRWTDFVFELGNRPARLIAPFGKDFTAHRVSVARHRRVDTTVNFSPESHFLQRIADETVQPLIDARLQDAAGSPGRAGRGAANGVTRGWWCAGWSETARVHKSS